MKIILIINLVVAILNITMAFLMAFAVKAQFKKEYPQAVLSKAPISEKISAYLRMLIASFCPLFNLVLLGNYMFNWESTRNATVVLLSDKIEMTV